MRGRDEGEKEDEKMERGRTATEREDEGRGRRRVTYGGCMPLHRAVHVLMYSS